MKNFYLIQNLLILTLLSILPSQLMGQDIGYVHTANSSNTSYNYTLLDHPSLNNNPNAKVVFSQRYVNGSGVSHEMSTGLWYTGSKWAIYNENNSIVMPLGVQFNILIGDNSSVETHIATTDNTSGHITRLTGYIQGDYLFFNSYYNPHSVYNNNILGTYYSGGSDIRLLYTETINPLPNNSGFRIMKGSSISSTFSSVVTSESNIIDNYMVIDHPLLNDNPNAVFIYSHYWGYPGGNNATYLPYVTEAFYHAGRWGIYVYGTPNFPQNVWFDFLIPDTILGVENVDANLSKITLYPNPAKDIVHFSSKSIMEEIQIFNVSGQHLMTLKNSGTHLEINVSSLPSGIYLAKIKTAQGWIGQKLIKQ
jgi:hypothetical protein